MGQDTDTKKSAMGPFVHSHRCISRPAAPAGPQGRWGVGGGEGGGGKRRRHRHRTTRWRDDDFSYVTTTWFHLITSL